MNLTRCIFLVGLFAVIPSIAFAQVEPSSEYGPYSPEEAAKRFVLHPDCKIELVACEPDVIDPVHIAFNTDGKLWVVEYTDYPNGPGDGQPGLSRIRVLSDDDEDGRYNNPVTFAEKLLFANGLMFWKDGVIVTTDGKIQFMRDTDGDGKSDETQVWFEGFATKNPQLRHNHPQLAIDCKIYVANGLRGGDIVPGPDNPWGLDPKAKPLSISGRDFRFDPLNGKYEAIAGMGQFGMTFDQFGNRFVCTNRNPCRQIVLEDEQLKLTPGLRIPRFYEDVAAAGEDSKLYPLSRTWTTSNLHANQFTAACGVLIYNGGPLVNEFSKNVFTCDPTANLVHRETLQRSGPTYKANPGRKKIEFLATKDEWFRPVNLSHGPSGSLYVVDMYRAVIEHPQFMPTELKDRPDLLLGTDKGRIWRISRPTISISKLGLQEHGYHRDKLGAQPVEELVKNLNLGGTRLKYVAPFWVRENSFRLLVERNDESVKQALLNSKHHTLYHIPLLNQKGVLTLNHLKDWFISKKIDDISIMPGGANLAIKTGQGNFQNDPKWIEIVNQFVNRSASGLGNLNSLNPPLDKTGQQIFVAPIISDLYSVLGNCEWRSITADNRISLLKTLIDGATPSNAPYWLSTYLGISARTDSLMVFEDLLSALKGSESTLILAPVVHDLAELVARQNQPGQIDQLLTSIPADTDLDEVTKLAAVAGLADGYPGGAGALRGRVAKLDAGQNATVKKILHNAAQQFAEKKLAPQLLPLVTSLLSVADDSESLQQLVEATGSGDSTRASLALTALLKRPAEQVNPTLVELLPKRRGSVRRSILQAMASNVSRAPALLDEIEAGRVPPLEIDSTMEKMFYRLSDKEIVARAKMLLKREPPADRVKVLADYQQVLKMDSDPLRGKAIFEKNCATCHKVGDVGVNVAPDISDSRTKTPDFYLMNILDPNRAIDANYFSFNVLDTDGKVHTGIVASETSSAVTLKMPEGKLVTIDREEIELFKNNGVSLMPVGLERTINKQQMADVISFIKNWRYLDGQIPKEVIK
ncbi:MAG: c-type cytochrome [Planctomicrobium sp.]|jgi:putative membrane-bound dehydrogenase-like protein|nr:c-type cytochrome [Planctomicrobium sp.]